MGEVLKSKRLAIIGSGAMGTALMRGLLQSGAMTADQIIAADIDEGRLKAAAMLGVATTMDNKWAVSQSDIVLLCVKPQVMDEVLADIALAIEPHRHCVISIAAGISIAHIETHLPDSTPVVRVMPNTPAQVLRIRKLAGKVKLVAFDASDTEIKALQDGIIQALIVQNPFRMGYEGVRYAVMKLQGKPIPKRVDTGVTVVTRRNFREPTIQRLLFPLHACRSFLRIPTRQS